MLLGDGNKSELDDDEVFEERTENWKKKVFAIPGVEVGSVIEYQYKLYSKYIHRLEPWYFQSKIFTRLSELTVYLPPGFQYSVLEKNLTNYNIEKTQKKVFNPYDHRKKVLRLYGEPKTCPVLKMNRV
ncbi:MAG: DUF3857 domain-containing protein [Caldithrix sp.]|nr:DUF3857 domain-containing protein [Caldithrix sp.]